LPNCCQKTFIFAQLFFKFPSEKKGRREKREKEKKKKRKREK
jgi:hypothetical protein